MGKLFDRIHRLVAEEKYLISWHAGQRLEERGVLEWQVVEGLSTARLVSESPRAKPNPKIDVEELLPDGTPVKAVWAHLKSENKAVLKRSTFSIERETCVRRRILKSERA